MKGLKILLATIFLLFSVGCTDSVQDEDVVIDNSQSESLEGYTYDDKDNRYINEDNGVWYVKEGEKNIIPKEEFVEENLIVNLDELILEDRENTVWKLKEIQEVIVEVRDSFYTLADKGYSNHYRMDRDWYYEQVKELNNLEDINVIRWKEPLKLPIYDDSRE